ncbi:MAG: hypothetical protein WCG47_18220, partial [Dermatophilaceae bacterium]
MTLADLYDEPKQTAGPTARRPGPRDPKPAVQPAGAADKASPAPRRRVVQTYVYVDAGGQPLMQALRYEPKGFSQCRWENGQWVSGGPPPQARVLFCLPDVLAWAAAGQIIHLTEGEKDAIALQQAGVPATSAPMGATKWQPQYAQQLAGASLVVLHADRD